MNRRFIAMMVILAMMLTAFVGCGNRNKPVSETTLPTTVPTETTIPPSLPGVVYNPEGGAENLDETEPENESQETTAPTTGNNNSTGETTAPTTGNNNSTGETTTPTTGNNNSTGETTTPTTGNNNSTGETTAPTTGSNNPTEGATAPTTEPATEPTTEPTTPPTTEPTTEPSTEPSTGGNTTVTAYEAYHAMSGADQKAFIDSFGSIEAFFAWYNAAKAEYEALHPDIEVGDGNVDLGGK